MIIFYYNILNGIYQKLHLQVNIYLAVLIFKDTFHDKCWVTNIRQLFVANFKKDKISKENLEHFIDAINKGT
jgi:hypothetical protein